MKLLSDHWSIPRASTAGLGGRPNAVPCRKWNAIASTGLKSNLLHVTASGLSVTTCEPLKSIGHWRHFMLLRVTSSGLSVTCESRSSIGHWRHFMLLRVTSSGLSVTTCVPFKSIGHWRHCMLLLTACLTLSGVSETGTKALFPKIKHKIKWLIIYFANSLYFFIIVTQIHVCTIILVAGSC